MKKKEIIIKNNELQIIEDPANTYKYNSNIKNCKKVIADIASVREMITAGNNPNIREFSSIRIQNYKTESMETATGDNIEINLGGQYVIVGTDYYTGTTTNIKSCNIPIEGGIICTNVFE